MIEATNANDHTAVHFAVVSELMLTSSIQRELT